MNEESYAYYKQWHSQFGLPELAVEDLIACDVMLGKSERWVYEEEYRLVSLGFEGGLPLLKFKYPGTDECPFEADAIIFGLETEEVVKQIIKNSFDVPCYQISAIPGTYELISNEIISSSRTAKHSEVEAG